MKDYLEFREKKRKSIYATALLSDGEILFWRVGQHPYHEYDFYKDFMRSGINQMEYFDSHKMKCEVMEFVFDEESEYKINNHVFKEVAKSFFRLFPISKDSCGESAY